MKKIKLSIYDGNRKVIADDLIKEANNNVDNFLKSKNLSEKQKRKFMDSYSKIIQGVSTGDIVGRNAGMQWADASDSILNDSNEDSQVLGYLGSIMKDLPSYEDNPIFYQNSLNEDLLTRLGGKLISDSDSAYEDRLFTIINSEERDDLGNIKLSNRKKLVTEVLDDIASNYANQDFSKSQFKDYEDFRNKITEFKDYLNNPENKFDTNSSVGELMRRVRVLGLDPMLFTNKINFNKTVNQPQVQEVSTPTNETSTVKKDDKNISLKLNTNDSKENPQDKTDDFDLLKKGINIKKDIIFDEDEYNKYNFKSYFNLPNYYGGMYPSSHKSSFNKSEYSKYENILNKIKDSFYNKNEISPYELKGIFENYSPNKLIGNSFKINNKIYIYEPNNSKDFKLKTIDIDGNIKLENITKPILDSLKKINNNKSLHKDLESKLRFLENNKSKIEELENIYKNDYLNKVSIPKGQTGLKIKNITHSNLDWNKNIFGSDAFNKTLQNINKDNLDKYNHLQNTYSNILNNIAKGYKYNQENAIKHVDVGRYQNDFNSMTYLNPHIKSFLGTDLLQVGEDSKDGKMGNVDSLFGDITYNRHLGKQLTDDEYRKVNDILNKNGVEAFYNPKTGMSNYKPLNINTSKPISTLTSQIVEQKTSVHSPLNLDFSKIKNLVAPNLPHIDKINSPIQSEEKPLYKEVGIEDKKIKKGINFDNIYRLGRFVENMLYNKKIKDIFKDSIKPNLSDPLILDRHITGDLLSKVNEYRKASHIERLGDIQTSDGLLRQASKLQANLNANAVRTQGDLIDNQTIKENTIEARRIADQNRMMEYEVSKNNKTSLYAADKAKKDTDIAYESQKHQSIKNLLSELEHEYQKNKYINNSLNQFEIQKKYNQDMQFIKETGESNKQRFLKEIELAQRAGNVDRVKKLTQEFQAYDNSLKNRLKLIMNKYNDEMLNLKRNGNVSYFSKGGAIIEVTKIRTLHDWDKNFKKSIDESNKLHNKKLNDLSKVTIKAILKALNFK